MRATNLQFTQVLQSLECKCSRLQVTGLSDAVGEEVGVGIVEGTNEGGNVARVGDGQAKVLVAQNSVSHRLKVRSQTGTLSVTIISVFKGLNVTRNLI